MKTLRLEKALLEKFPCESGHYVIRGEEIWLSWYGDRVDLVVRNPQGLPPDDVAILWFFNLFSPTGRQLAEEYNARMRPPPPQQDEPDPNH